jgi:hypothetical protein
MATASGAATDAIVRQADSFSTLSSALSERPAQALDFRFARICVRRVEWSILPFHDLKQHDFGFDRHAATTRLIPVSICWQQGVQSSQGHLEEFGFRAGPPTTLSAATAREALLPR